MKGHVIAQGELVGRYAKKSSASLRPAAAGGTHALPWRAFE